MRVYVLEIHGNMLIERGSDYHVVNGGSTPTRSRAACALPVWAHHPQSPLPSWPTCSTPPPRASPPRSSLLGIAVEPIPPRRPRARAALGRGDRRGMATGDVGAARIASRRTIRAPGLGRQRHGPPAAPSCSPLEFSSKATRTSGRLSPKALASTGPQFSLKRSTRFIYRAPPVFPVPG
jgi:hypothetical protein